MKKVAPVQSEPSRWRPSSSYANSRALHHPNNVQNTYQEHSFNSSSNLGGKQPEGSSFVPHEALQAATIDSSKSKHALKKSEAEPAAHRTLVEHRNDVPQKRTLGTA